MKYTLAIKRAYDLYGLLSKDISQAGAEQELSAFNTKKLLKVINLKVSEILYTLSKMNKELQIVLVGDGMCGKTSMINVFLNNRFPVTYMPTIYENHTCKIKDAGKEVSLRMWDTAVQEDFEIFRPLLYRKATVFIVMYSVDRPESLENVYEKWIPELRQHCPSAPVILVAGKTDLRNKASVLAQLSEDGLAPVSTSDGKQMARKIKAFAFRECSALTRKGVREVFKTAVHAAYVKTEKNPLKWLSRARVMA